MKDEGEVGGPRVRYAPGPRRPNLFPAYNLVLEARSCTPAISPSSQPAFLAKLW